MKALNDHVEFVNSIEEDGTKKDDCYEKFLNAFYLENPGHIIN
jgi:hypothetical protein